jgi:hypothetical protein
MWRAMMTASFCWVAFDHYVGDDKGALLIAALIRHLFH